MKNIIYESIHNRYSTSEILTNVFRNIHIKYVLLETTIYNTQDLDL